VLDEIGQAARGHRPEAQVVRAVAFIALNVFVEVTNIEQKRRAFSVVQVG